jgi:putative protease
MKKVELLAPAKNIKAIKAATKYADSVYFGIKKFNMRIRSDNFSLENLNKVVDFCHRNDLKVYLTTKLLIYDNELKFFREIIERSQEAGVNAVIVHDIAVIQIAKEIGIPFHISTQFNVSNSISANFYENQGAERIILARELSHEKIKNQGKLVNKTPKETKN